MPCYNISPETIEGVTHWYLTSPNSDDPDDVIFDSTNLLDVLLLLAQNGVPKENVSLNVNVVD